MFQKLHIEEYDSGKIDSFCCRILVAEDEDAFMAGEYTILSSVIFEATRYKALAAARKEALETLNAWAEGIAAYEMSSEE